MILDLFLLFQTQTQISHTSSDINFFVSSYSQNSPTSSPDSLHNVPNTFCTFAHILYDIAPQIDYVDSIEQNTIFPEPNTIIPVISLIVLSEIATVLIRCKKCIFAWLYR